MLPELLTFLKVLLIPSSSDGSAVFWAKRMLIAMILFAALWIVAGLLKHLLETYAKKLTAFTNTDLDDRILQRISPSLTLLLSFLGGYIALNTLPLQGGFFSVLSGGLFVAIVLIFSLIIYRGLDELLNWYMDRVQEQEGVNSQHLTPVLRKLISIFLVGASLIIILKKFNYDILSLLTAFGIGSLAIGLAAKDTLAQMISGLTLLVDRPFRIGDRIKLADGQVGDVVDIGLRSTKVQGLDTTVMIIPNSDLCNSKLTNMVRPTAVVQGRVTIGVSYGSDIEKVKELLLDIARTTDEVLEDPEPLVLFTSFGDSALNLLFLFWVASPLRLGVVTDRINCTIIRRFREEGVEIPFPIRTVYLQQMEQQQNN